MIFFLLSCCVWGAGRGPTCHSAVSEARGLLSGIPEHFSGLASAVVDFSTRGVVRSHLYLWIRNVSLGSLSWGYGAGFLISP